MTTGNDLINGNNKYFYNGRISLNLDIFKNTKFANIFTNVYEGVFYSNPVDEYKQCIQECSGLLKEVTDEILEVSGEHYKVLWETNPIINPDPDYISKSADLKSWSENEILRFFIINKEDIAKKNTAIITPMLVSICSFDKSLIVNIADIPEILH